MNKETKTKKKLWKIIFIIIAIILALAVIFFAYFAVFYHAGDDAISALSGNASVSVEKIDGGYYFDGPGKDSAIVFYSGGKVQDEAYAPLMLKLSEAGFDCFLADIPLNFAFFGENIADSFISSYKYDNWIMAGHSLGGVVASSYAEKHVDMVDGLILLASYPSVELDDSISLLLIYGDEDGVLNIDKFDQSSPLWPNNNQKEVISGGNHAQFGDYGNQKGDGLASITRDEQMDETVRIVNMWWQEGKKTQWAGTAYFMGII